jgi:hypothetical protein
LVKGGDDMRQDAVMQQVFENVNYTLGRDEETQKRQLRVHTYRIVPLTPQTGVLEWVENTLAFGSILTDSKRGAHPRYYPNDWSHMQCREHLKNAVDNNDKLIRFQEVCRRFHPAFRFFFLERYPDPLQWMAARLAYTRSVAANSIIGYVLGIGDRHAHNVCHMSYVVCRMSYVVCRISYVVCHMCQSLCAYPPLTCSSLLCRMPYSAVHIQTYRSILSLTLSLPPVTPRSPPTLRS